MLGYFVQTIMKSLRLVSGQNVLYSKVKCFVQDHLFDQQIDLESTNTPRNLSEPVASKTVIETFKKTINNLTVQDTGNTEIKDMIKLRQTRPFMVNNQYHLIPNKSGFNRVIGDSHFELQFASFLENCKDVAAFAKNYLAIHFKLDYVNADGDISNYYQEPPRLIKLCPCSLIDNKTVVVIIVTIC